MNITELLAQPQEEAVENEDERYVLDTSVLLHDPECIYKLDGHVIITREVLIELDNNKSRDGQVGKKARQVVRELNKLFLNPSRKEVVTEDGHKISLYSDLIRRREVEQMPQYIFHTEVDSTLPGTLPDRDPSRISLVREEDDTDTQILLTAYKLNATLVTNDKILKLMAVQSEIPVKEYDTGRNMDGLMYTGIHFETTTSNNIDQLFDAKSLDADLLDCGNELRENEFLQLSACDSGASAVGRYRQGDVQPIFERTIHSVTPKNREQCMVLDVLLDPGVELVTIIGVSGTGKTLLALAAGLEQVVELESYNKVVVTRPNVDAAEPLGFIPGELEEKLHPWMQPFYDNIDYMYSQRSKEVRPEEVVAEYKERNLLDIQALQHIRGRSIPNQYFIIDEAQNTTPDTIKTILTRAGEGSKFVFTGDIEQIDHNYVDEYTNGLSYLVRQFKDEKNAAHIRLQKSERSQLAKQGAKLL